MLRRTKQTFMCRLGYDGFFFSSEIFQVYFHDDKSRFLMALAVISWLLIRTESRYFVDFTTNSKIMSCLENEKE